MASEKLLLPWLIHAAVPLRFHNNLRYTETSVDGNPRRHVPVRRQQDNMFCMGQRFASFGSVSSLTNDCVVVGGDSFHTKLRLASFNLDSQFFCKSRLELQTARKTPRYYLIAPAQISSQYTANLCLNVCRFPSSCFRRLPCSSIKHFQVNHLNSSR